MEGSFLREVEERSPAVREEAVVPSSALVKAFHLLEVHRQTTDVVYQHVTTGSGQPADALQNRHRPMHNTEFS